MSLLHGGDELEKFEKIYRAYFSDVYRYLIWLTKDVHIAEEITAQTFTKALANLDQFRGESEIRVWLCQIAKNTYFSSIKKKTLPIETVKESEGQSLEDEILEKETVHILEGLVSELKEPYNEVFHLRVYGELSFREIGKLFDKTENWACVTYYRARKEIMKKMEVINE